MNEPKYHKIICNGCRSPVGIPTRLWDRGLTRPCPKCQSPMLLGPDSLNVKDKHSITASNYVNDSIKEAIKNDENKNISAPKIKIFQKLAWVALAFTALFTTAYCISPLLMVSELSDVNNESSVIDVRNGRAINKRQETTITIPQAENVNNKINYGREMTEDERLGSTLNNKYNETTNITYDKLLIYSQIVARNKTIDFIFAYGNIGAINLEGIESVRVLLSALKTDDIPKNLKTIQNQAVNFYEETLGSGDSSTWFKFNSVKNILDPSFSDYVAAAGNDATMEKMLTFDSKLQQLKTKWWQLLEPNFVDIYSKAPLSKNTLTVGVREVPRPVVPFGDNDSIKTNEVSVVVSNPSNVVLKDILLVMYKEEPAYNTSPAVHVFFFESLNAMDSIPLLTYFERITPEGFNKLPRIRREFEGFNLNNIWTVYSIVGAEKVPSYKIQL